MSRRVRRAATGHRIGESHHRARMTDGDVELARQLREQGQSYSAVARVFDDYNPPITKHYIRNITTLGRRA